MGSGHDGDPRQRGIHRHELEAHNSRRRARQVGGGVGGVGGVGGAGGVDGVGGVGGISRVFHPFSLTHLHPVPHVVHKCGGGIRDIR